MSATQPSQLRQTALRVIDGYKKWDIEAIMAPRAENCTQQVFPHRLERPLQNNSAYREYFTTAVMPLFSNFQVYIMDTVEDSGANKVAFHVRSTATTPLGDYANEYMIIIHTTEDQTQATQIKEFVDSGYSEDYFKRLRAHLEKAKAQ